MSSERFPGKVLHRIQGKPMLQYLLESVNQCRFLQDIVVATSIESSDDLISNFCDSFGVKCYRGPLEDVAGRFTGAIKSYGIDAFVRICGDSPLIDFRLIDNAVETYINNTHDIVTNVLKRTFPKGHSVEVFNSCLFIKTYPLMLKIEDREHVTSYFYEHRSQYSFYNFESGHDYGDMQLSVDTIEDMEQFKKIVSLMKKSHWEYGLEELIRLRS